MTTEQILQMNIRELEKLTPKELRQSVSTLRSTSRKRYERVVESELYSPSVESLRKSATQEIFTPLRELADEQLINEFKRYRQFLKAPTSTVGGARKSNKKLREETKKATGVDFDTDELLHYYSLVDQARKTEVGGVIDYRIIILRALAVAKYPMSLKEIEEAIVTIDKSNISIAIFHIMYKMIFTK